MSGAGKASGDRLAESGRDPTDGKERVKHVEGDPQQPRPLYQRSHMGSDVLPVNGFFFSFMRMSKVGFGHDCRSRVGRNAERLHDLINVQRRRKKKLGR